MQLSLEPCPALGPSTGGPGEGVGGEAASLMSTRQQQQELALTTMASVLTGSVLSTYMRPLSQT